MHTEIIAFCLPIAPYKYQCGHLNAQAWAQPAMAGSALIHVDARVFTARYGPRATDKGELNG
jgi:hypothetical protein